MKKTVKFELDESKIRILIEKNVNIKNEDMYSIAICALSAIVKKLDFKNDEDLFTFLFIAVMGDIKKSIEASTDNNIEKQQMLS